MSSDPIIGKKLGDYIIVDILGQGGMARVYRGLDKKLNRYAAVKVIDASTIREDEAEYRKRFQNEARAIARLSHPNIVGIYQFDQADHLYYMAMSFIEGKDLRSILKQHDKNGTRMPIPEILNIIRDIGAALDYSHTEAVIHRDIKPSNIMVTNSGKAILTDFGLALSVPEGTFGNTFGSAHYIAPEQAINSAQAVPQSDIYSLAIVLFEMLTNRVPFDDPSAMAVAMKHLTDPPPPPSRINPALPPQVDQIVVRAMDKDPKKRFASCAELVKALEEAFARQDDSDIKKPVAAPPPPKPVVTNTATMQVVKEKSGFETNPIAPVSDDAPTVTDSKASAGTRSAILKEQGRRSRQKWLRQAGIVGVVLLTLGAAALLLSQQTGVLTASATETAVQAALVSGGSATPEAEASATPVPPTDTTVPTEEATATEALASPTQSEAGVTASVTPLGVVSATATATIPAAAASATESPSASATRSSPIGLTTIAPQTADAITLRYDDQVLTVYNTSADEVNMSNLMFTLTLANGSTAEFDSDEWSQNNSQSISSLSPGDCLQVIRNDRFLSSRDTKPEDCNFVQGWRQINIRRVFWISEVEGATFTVRRGSALLATCTISSGECSFDPDGS